MHCIIGVRCISTGTRLGIIRKKGNKQENMGNEEKAC
jgi:hypothetical protein